MYWDVSNIYGWQILQKLAVDVFEWRQKKFIFDEELLQDYREDRDKIYILEVELSCWVSKEHIRVKQRSVVFTQKNENWKM